MTKYDNIPGFPGYYISKGEDFGLIVKMGNGKN